MFVLGVACDILCLYIWPVEMVVNDVEVLLFQERISDVDSMLDSHVLVDSCVQGDLAEMVKYSRSGQDMCQAVLREVNVSLAFAFAYLETLLGLQLSEAPTGETSTWALVALWLQFICLAAYTIWARGVGPRFRPDQMSDLTWKDLLFFLVGLLVLVLVTFYVGRCVVTLLDCCALCSVTVSVSLARARCLKTKPFLYTLIGGACGLSWR